LGGGGKWRGKKSAQFGGDRFHSLREKKELAPANKPPKTRFEAQKKNFTRESSKAHALKKNRGGEMTSGRGGGAGGNRKLLRGSGESFRFYKGKREKKGKYKTAKEGEEGDLHRDD